MWKKICLAALFLAAWPALPGAAGAVNVTYDWAQNGDFVRVEDIIGVPLIVTAGENVILSGSVVPANAANRTVGWSLVDAGTTGASITRVDNNTSIISTTAAGVVIVQGIVTGGLGPGHDYQKQFSVTVTSGGGGGGIPPVIMSAPPPAGNVGEAYSHTLVATGSMPVTWTLVNGYLPHGLVLYNSGVISGTPTTAGSYNFTVTASNNWGNDTRAFYITVGQSSGVRPAIRTDSLPRGYLDWYYSETLDADGAQPITWTMVSGNLPRGVTLYSDSGVISGRPSRTGTFRFTVRARNSAGYDEKRLSIRVRENNYWDDGCNAGVGSAAAAALLMGVKAAFGNRKNKKQL